ncbi:MAG: type II toxin-antitoxin system Phd/YefM family antitoxin [Pseudomonadota bacterium]
MPKVSAREFEQDLPKFKQSATKEPVVIVQEGGDDLVSLSLESYRRLMAQPGAHETPADARDDLIASRLQTHRQTIEKLAQ